MTSLALFAPMPGGGWYSPTVEIPPGVFVEQCRQLERIPLLAAEELVEFWANWSRCEAGWRRIGYEAGRGFGEFSFRADLRDSEVMDPRTWFIGEGGCRVRLDGWSAATEEEERRLGLRPWAVEFPKRDRGDGAPGFVRRRFWFASRHRVPVMVPVSRAKVREAQERRAAARLALLLHVGRLRAARTEVSP